MRRFFIAPSQIRQGQAIITDQEARHISTVLRLRPGSVIELFDGHGMAYTAEIATVGKTEVSTRIVSSWQHTESGPLLTLAQGLSKGKKMDLIIQKATELGVHDLIPVRSQHCAVGDTSPNQVDRWQRIAHEACKQCGRPTPLICRDSLSFEQLLPQVASFTQAIIFWEEAEAAPLSFPPLSASARVLLLIGPEGGFSHQEADAALAGGFRAATLGPRMLRAETAAIAATAIVQFLLGNLNRDQGQ